MIERKRKEFEGRTPLFSARSETAISLDLEFFSPGQGKHQRGKDLMRTQQE